MTQLCSWWSILILPWLPFRVSAFSWVLGRSLHLKRRLNRGKEATSPTISLSLLPLLKFVCFFCSHDSCLLDVQRQSCFSTSFFIFIQKLFKSWPLSASKMFKDGHFLPFLLLMFLPPSVTPPSSESNPVFVDDMFYVQIKHTGRQNDEGLYVVHSCTKCCGPGHPGKSAHQWSVDLYCCLSAFFGTRRPTFHWPISVIYDSPSVLCFWY